MQALTQEGCRGCPRSVSGLGLHSSLHCLGQSQVSVSCSHLICLSGAASPPCTVTHSSAVQEKVWGVWPQANRGCWLLGQRTSEPWCQAHSGAHLWAKQPSKAPAMCVCPTSALQGCLGTHYTPTPAAMYSFPVGHIFLPKVPTRVHRSQSTQGILISSAAKPTYLKSHCGVTVSTDMPKWLWALGI